MASSRRGWSPDAVVVVALIVLHFTLYRFFVQWPALPNLMIGGLLLAALRLRAGYAAFLGFSLGVLEAAMALAGFTPGQAEALRRRLHRHLVSGRAVDGGKARNGHPPAAAHRRDRNRYGTVRREDGRTRG